MSKCRHTKIKTEKCPDTGNTIVWFSKWSVTTKWEDPIHLIMKEASLTVYRHYGPSVYHFGDFKSFEAFEAGDVLFCCKAAKDHLKQIWAAVH